MSLNFEKFASEGNVFIRKLATELGYPDDEKKAARVLRSVLHAIRDLLPPANSVHLLSQLPFFIKGIYAERWSLKPSAVRIKHREDLVQKILDNDGITAENDFSNSKEVEDAIAVIFIQLSDYISPGELEKIKATLPKEIKAFLGPFLVVD